LKGLRAGFGAKVPKGEPDLFDDGRQHGKKTGVPTGD
jgi:hypothetical protein